MYKIEKFTMIALALIVMGGVLLAQQPEVNSSSTKIMFINFTQVLTGTDEAQQKLGKIQKFVEQQNRENETRTQELEQRQKKFQEQQRALNPQTLAEMQSEIAKLDRDLKRYREDTAAEIEAQRNRIFAELGQKIQGILTETARQNGYLAIFNWDALLQNNLGSYFDPANDITEDIISQFNRKYTVPGSGQ